MTIQSNNKYISEWAFSFTYQILRLHSPAVCTVRYSVKDLFEIHLKIYIYLALTVPKYIDDFPAMLLMKNALLQTNVSTFLQIFFVYFQIKIYSLLSKSDLFSLFHLLISDAFHFLFQDGPTKRFESHFPTFPDIE